LVEKRGPLPPAEACRLTTTVARAVQAAHAAGVLHRDLKPSNILLTATRGPKPADLNPEDAWAPKVSDFGLAKRLDRNDGLTVGTGGLGTPGYMPPEQISRKNGEVGPAADVYGLGATLYHLLTGRPPHTGDTKEEVITKVLSDPPDRPRTVRTDIPPGLEGIVVKCLEKDPRNRYPSAAALADDLDRFLAGKAPTAPRLTPLRRVARWAGRNRAPLAGVVAGLLAALGLVFLTLFLGGQRPETAALAESPDWADVVAAVRKDLAAGNPVELTPKSGPPRCYRCLLEVNPPQKSSLGDDGFEFHAFGTSLLELCPAPGVAKYRVSLELRQLMSQAANGPGEEYIGFYFGYGSAKGENGTTAHTMLAVPFTEGMDPGARNGRHPVGFSRLGYYQDPRHALTQNRATSAVLWFTPKPTRPGPWRTVTLDVSKDQVLVRWKSTAEAEVETLVDWSGEKARKWYDELKADMNRYAPGVQADLPVWGPDLPFGVVSSRASVAVKNVAVTPLR
jgi:hypothetical protein